MEQRMITSPLDMLCPFLHSILNFQISEKKASWGEKAPLIHRNLQFQEKIIR